MVCEAGFLCTTGACTVDPASRWNVVLESVTVATTRYDGAQWDLVGITPDPYVEVIVGNSASAPVGTTGSGVDAYTVTFDGGATATDLRASEIMSFIGFRVSDDDSPPSATDDFVGYCGGPPAAEVFASPQTFECRVDPSAMNSGFTLLWHLERF